MALSSDEKKALIIGGGVAVLALAWYLTKGSLIPPGASGVQGAPVLGSSAPGYTDYNVSPFKSPAASTLGKTPLDGLRANDCCGDKTCRSAGGINTGNAPTSVEQLYNWYANDNPNFVSKFAGQVQAYEAPPLNINELAALAAPSTQYYYKDGLGFFSEEMY